MQVPDLVIKELLEAIDEAISYLYLYWEENLVIGESLMAVERKDILKAIKRLNNAKHKLEETAKGDEHA